MATLEQLDRRSAEQECFARDVVAGLRATPRSIPSKYFYDARGSRLFQLITELPEYYLTRCELEILERHGGQIAAHMGGRTCRLIELGAGDGCKTIALLRHVIALGCDFQFAPIDICRNSIRGLAARIQRELPEAADRVQGVTADYLDGLRQLAKGTAERNFLLFLGSNIGNFNPRAARRFLEAVRRTLNPGDLFLIGFDLQKSIPLIRQAYNDSRGVTREFNFNLLDRINRELGGDFSRDNFLHYAPYNAHANCMESWLVSRKQQRVTLSALECAFDFEAWDAVQVERSYKYSLGDIESLARETGFSIVEHFLDRRSYFADSLWRA